MTDKTLYAAFIFVLTYLLITVQKIPGIKLAGNFTLVGSVANLIVAEIAKDGGATIGFWEYFRVGAPITIITILIGAFWLLYV